ncbi:hypothetical protein EV191_13112 [Tamaricihabitans halophyticus]|uniref:Cobyrinic acid a,c-diamide synthase n=1 Tax=Tamaricihabitans halophyticus TaxID=1262583 RepID=A0A4R2PT95_9PSEU|nr:cobyrinic acid a,c-diamide synthase [Tamaricihabitans halophyticus]TCP39212.1 hypothetical protein EV191_13112 [Tamaricihabitans halophyticus]
MNRRISLPGAAELFRSTSGNTTESALSGAEDAQAGWFTPTKEPAESSEVAASGTAVAETKAEPAGAPARRAVRSERRGTPRQKHDSKITVYVSGDELLAMERARLALRAEHDLVVDRGRLVREAVAVLLADFEDTGAESVLVRRLRDGEEQRGDGGK